MVRCKPLQKRLQEAKPLSVDERVHLRDCPRCAAFLQQWESWRRELERRGSRLQPDAGFAARVVASLPTRTSPVEWAALRLLPAGAALVLVLTGWCVLRGLTPSAVMGQVSTQDSLTWVLDGEGGS